MTTEEKAKLDAGIASGKYRVLSTHPKDLEAVIEKTKQYEAMSETERRISRRC